MLYYYYGNKEDLFLAVLESRYAHIRRAELGLRLGELDPAEGIRRLVAFTWDYYLKHPEFLTLLNSENLHRGAPPPPLAPDRRDALAADRDAARPARARRARGQVPARRRPGAALHLHRRRWATST